MSGETESIKSFLEDYEEAFKTPDKKAVFLIGILTKFLLDVQYTNRGSTPFRSKMYSLKLNQRRLKRLFPEIVEKLREYNVSYPRLEKHISEVLVEVENSGWNLSKDEISYYFALGLCLGGTFK